MYVCLRKATRTCSSYAKRRTKPSAIMVRPCATARRTWSRK
jgi:hypothetical protein